MIVSYHNHTKWSDGAATLEEMIAGAREAGLNEFGVSDHYALFPDGRPLWWAMAPAFLEEYVACVQDAAAQAGVILRLGIEMDYFPETVAESAARFVRHPFDYIIGGVHFVDGFPIDTDASDWEPLSENEINDIWRLYWTRIRQLADSRVCDVIAHLDLPKKFGCLSTVDLSAEEDAALTAIAAAGVAIEINTAGWKKPIAEAYPSEPLLREARQRGIPLIISADAHTPQDVNSNFDRARILAAQAGYTELLRFKQRTATPIPL